MAAYESQGRTEEKKKRLVERRERLTALLSEERDMYEVRDTFGNTKCLSHLVFSWYTCAARIQGVCIWKIRSHEEQVVPHHYCSRYRFVPFHAEPIS